MTTRYVHRSKGTGSQTGASAYSLASRPAARLSDALHIALPGDTIVVLDTGEYAEGEILIDKPITLRSEALSSIKSLANSGHYRPGSLPQLVPARGHPQRVMRIQFAKDAPTGPVSVSGFEIANGVASNTPSDPVWGVGGGVAIIDLNDVVIRDCFIRNNGTIGMSLKTYSTIAFKDAVAGRVADVISSAPGIDPSLTATLAALVRTALDGQMPSSRANSPLFGQCFGGGVCFAWSSGRIERCGIVGNRANGRGGGIAVVGYGWPTISECLIRDNATGDQSFARRDGGGIAAEISVPDKLGRNLTEADLLKTLTDWLTTVPTAVLVAQASVSFLIGLYNAYKAGRLSGKDVALKILYAFARIYLKVERWSSWDQAKIADARAKNVSVEKCVINNNRAFDDGGGIYCSVLSRLSISQSRVELNNADSGGGGGIRMSMGSDITMVDTMIADNRCGGDKVGGGGIAVRNGTVTINGSSTGAAGVRTNQARRWAGGGILFQCISEGDLARIPDMWQAIMIDVFGFQAMNVKITGTFPITGNKAGPVPGADCHGQGGGIYLLHGDFADAAELHIEIEQFARDCKGNKASSTSILGRKPSGTCKDVIKKVTNEIAVVDLSARISDGDLDVPKYLGRSLRHIMGSATTLFYDS